MSISKPQRPALRYHGGKWRLAPWIISYFPEHTVYVESYGGGGSVLLRKDRVYAEIYNDLDGEIVNFFRVLRDRGEELIGKIAITPYAREEYTQSYRETSNDLERARLTAIRSFMGFASGSVTLAKDCGFKVKGNYSGEYGNPKTGFRNYSDIKRGGGGTVAGDWAKLPEAYQSVIDRLQGVIIENKDAKQVMAQHDTPNTLHYVDPPYVLSSRTVAHRDVYRHELQNQDHAELADFLGSLSGMVVVSGYRTDLYDKLFDDYLRIDKEVKVGTCGKRTESLWINRAAQERLEPLYMQMVGE